MKIFFGAGIEIYSKAAMDMCINQFHNPHYNTFLTFNHISLNKMMREVLNVVYCIYISFYIVTNCKDILTKPL